MGGRGSSSATMRVFTLGTKDGNEKFLEDAKLRASKLQSAQSPTDFVNARKNALVFTEAADKRISRLDLEIAQTKNEMERYSRDATGYPNKVPGTTKDGYQRYREAQQKYNNLVSARGAVVDAKAVVNQALTEKEQQRQKKTFVNSYGEATKRSITTSGYEQAQKRQQKAVLRNMGY